MTREEVIKALVDIDYDIQIGEDDYLENIMRVGFKGYNNMSNKELEDMYNFNLSDEEKLLIKE